MSAAVDSTRWTFEERLVGRTGREILLVVAHDAHDLRWRRMRQRALETETKAKGEQMGLRTFLMSLLIVGVLASSWVAAGPAQEILEDLARSERNERRIAGYTYLGIGAAVGLVSTAVLIDSGIGIYGVVVGGLIALPGVVALVVPSAAELECRQGCDSEDDSALALERLADRGRLERFVSGIVNIAAGVASLLHPFGYFTRYDYVYTAMSSFGMAAVDFLFPSKEERAYARYRERVDQGA